MIHSANEIGSNIRAARRNKGMSQTDLANALDKTLRTVQKYESGDIEPSLSMIESIARVLEVDPESLFIHTAPKPYTLADFLSSVYELGEKAEVKYDIDVKTDPETKKMSCSIRFDEEAPDARQNLNICVFLEYFKRQREYFEYYMTTHEELKTWVDGELEELSAIKLYDRHYEKLSDEERTRRTRAIFAAQEEEKRRYQKQSDENPDE